MASTALPRLVATSLADRLRVMPAVVITGPRQSGKSTLARFLTPGTRQYRTLDDLEVLAAARDDPQLLVGGSGPVTLDEVQRAPGLLHEVKRAVDENRVAGRFLLTGSANLLMMRQVSESLAGRASYLTLWPMTRREQLGEGRGGLWQELLSAPDDAWPEVLRAGPGPADWRSHVKRGGFPTPAVELKTDVDRAIWFDGYVKTYLERDLRELSSISSLPDFARLMRVACLRLGQMINQTELGREVALPQATVHRWLNLLETSYMLVRLPAYSLNRGKRLIKSPKLYWGDTGVALHLAGSEEPRGAHLENLVLNDLLAWRDSRVARAEVFYWRTVNGEEVDFVIEANGRLLPIEVKATSRPRLADVTRLRAFRKEYSDISRSGLLLHAGEVTEWIAPDVLALPWWRVM